MRHIVFLLFFCAIYSCQRPVANNEIKKSLPIIEFQASKDTLKQGEVFKAKIWLSDTSFLLIKDVVDDKEQRVYPVFKVNGKIIPNHYSDYYTIIDTANTEVVYPEFPGYREIECSIIFPHPEIGEGTVELTKLITYQSCPK